MQVVGEVIFLAGHLSTHLPAYPFHVSSLLNFYTPLLTYAPNHQFTLPANLSTYLPFYTVMSCEA